MKSKQECPKCNLDMSWRRKAYLKKDGTVVQRWYCPVCGKYFSTPIPR